MSNENPESKMIEPDPLAIAPPIVVDQAALRAASDEVEDTAKELAKAANNAKAAALQLELAALDGAPAFEECMLQTGPEIKKRYTAEHAEKIEIRRNAAIYMLARQCPVEDIAKILRMNLRTITALAALNGQQLAAFSEGYAQELLAKAGAAFSLASTKQNEASFLQLATGAGIMVDKAIAIKGGLPPTAEENAIDLEAEDPALKAAREFVQRKLKSANPTTQSKP